MQIAKHDLGLEVLPHFLPAISLAILRILHVSWRHGQEFVCLFFQSNISFSLNTATFLIVQVLSRHCGLRFGLIQRLDVRRVNLEVHDLVTVDKPQLLAYKFATHLVFIILLLVALLDLLVLVELDVAGSKLAF